MKHLLAIASVVIVMTLPTEVDAQFDVGAYGGIGGSDANNNVPWTLGALVFPDSSRWSIGLDFAGEGTALNNTSGHRNTIEQAWSMNILVGQSLRMGSQWQAGVSGLVGMRSTNKICADSYLGYECYADAAPRREFAPNVGGVAHLSFRSLLIGGRLTGESTQVLIGVMF